jgi:hypothetical protein
MEKGGMKGYKRVRNRFLNWFRVKMALEKEGFVGFFNVSTFQNMLLSSNVF